MRIARLNADKAFKDIKELLAGLIDVFKTFAQIISQMTESERTSKYEACGYIDTLYFVRIKRISLKYLKRVNSRLIKRKVKQRARESHRKIFLEEEDEE